MLMYFILAAVLILAYRTKPNCRPGALAIAYFTLCYVLTGIFTRFSGLHLTAGQYYLVMGTASFLLIVLYQSFDATPLILLAGLCELSIIALNIICILGVKWLAIHYVACVTVINYVELSLLVWRWADGDGIGGRRIYSKLYHLAWPFVSARHRVLAFNQEKEQGA